MLPLTDEEPRMTKRKPISTADAVDQAEREHDEEAEANAALAAADKDEPPLSDAAEAAAPAEHDDTPAAAGAPEEPKADTLRTFRVRKTLPIKLTPEEIAQKAAEAMTLTAEVEQVEDEKKRVTTDFADRIKMIRGQIRGLVHQHKTGEEMRAVDAEQHFDLTRKRTWYTHRGERYDEREMTAREVREFTETLFGDAQVEGAVPADQAEPAAKPRNADELAKEAGEKADGKPAGIAAAMGMPPAKVTRGKKKKPAVTVQAVTGEGAPVDPGVAAVFKSETKKGGKRDHVSL